MIRIVAVAVLMCTAASPASGQSLEAYLSLLGRFATDADGAVEQLVTTAAWTRRSIEDNVRVCLPLKAGMGGDASPCDTRRRALAAVLHAEASMRLSGSDSERALLHFRLARQLGAQIKERPAFTEKWYEFLTMMRLSEGDTVLARELAMEAESHLRGSPIPPFLLGVVREVSVMFDFGNVRERLPRDDQFKRRVNAAMAEADRQYSRALSIDPAFHRARLRLGWAMFVQDDRSAEKMLLLARESPDPSVRYLSKLFLGALAARRMQLDLALSHYQAAREEGPAYQSACVAVSQTLHALAEQARSEAVAAECLASLGDDPWWSYRAGAAEPSLIVDLRLEAARP